MQTFFLCRRPQGYVLLITVLIIGAVGAAIAVAIPLLGASATQAGIIMHQGSQAKALADGCAEYALDKLRSSDAYAGNETLNIGNGSCMIRPILGSGNSNRTVQTTGTVGSVTRKVQIQIATVSPEMILGSFKEVWGFP